ncbi:MAG: type II toxin-antitoxin system RelE/ParE family toxin [Planctomycetota bacterium]
MTRILLTDRAVRDVEEIERYSEGRWGRAVADAYLDDIERALDRIGASPGIIQRRLAVSAHLRFYPVREHVLVCDMVLGAVVVLAVWHGSMDVAARIGVLAPQLARDLASARVRLGG